MADQMASMLMGGDSDSDDDSNGDVQVVGQGSVAPKPVAPKPVAVAAPVVAATINPVMQNVASPQVQKTPIPQQRPPPQRAPVPVQQTTQPQRPVATQPSVVSAQVNPAAPMRNNIGVVGTSGTNNGTSSIAMNNMQQQRRVSASMQPNAQPSSNPSPRHSHPHSSHIAPTVNPISSNRQPHSRPATSVGQPIPAQRSRQTSNTSMYSQNTHVATSSGSARTPTASSLSTPSNTVQQSYSTNKSHVRQSAAVPTPAPKVPAFDFEPTPIAELKRKSQPPHLQSPVQQQQQASVQQPSRHHPMHTNTNRQTQQQHISQVSRQSHSSSQHPMRKQGSTSTHQSSSSSRTHYQSTSSSARATPASDKSKNRKEEFLMFTKVLMKYLEQKDKEMHLKARHVIKECARKNKEGDPAFSSLSASMQKQLKKLVDRKQGANYWAKAEDYLRQWLYNTYKKNKKYSEEEAQRKARYTAKQASLPLDQSLPPYKQKTSQPASLPQPSPTVQMQQHQQMQKKQQGQLQQQQNQEQQKAVVQNQQMEKSQPATKKPKAETKPAAAKKAPKKKTPAPKGKTASTKKKNARKTPTSSEKKSTAKESSKPLSTEPKEYQEAMEMLHHVVDYDVSSIGLILGNLNGNKHKEDIDISEEQRKLLYDDFGITKIKPRRGLYGGDKSRIASPTSVAPEKEDEGDSSSKLPLYIQGWDKRNIVSARIAWAKLRLMEDELEEMEKTSSKLPLPKESNQKPTEVKSTDEKDSTPDVSDGSWFNDEMAEQDETLALISEATQYYIRTALEGAMNLAKKRANIEGIRLMNQQHLLVAEKQKNPTTENRKPPLMLRLGCDTRRQYSMVQGNAAKTSQRFEEALERQEDMKPMNRESMCNASSMAELSAIPRLPSAAKKAEVNAKRMFEVHGGKHATEPPLGRVPKKMKITAKDFSSCINQPSFAVSKRQVLTNSFI